MVILTQFAASLAALATLATAAPAPAADVTQQKSFTVNQIEKQLDKEKKINVPGMYAQALEKYGGAVPAHVKAAADRGSVVTRPEQYDSEYLTPVDVGGTTMHLDFDTGSADL